MTAVCPSTTLPVWGFKLATFRLKADHNLYQGKPAMTNIANSKWVHSGPLHWLEEMTRGGAKETGKRAAWGETPSHTAGQEVLDGDTLPSCQHTDTHTGHHSLSHHMTLVTSSVADRTMCCASAAETRQHSGLSVADGNVIKQHSHSAVISNGQISVKAVSKQDVLNLIRGNYINKQTTICRINQNASLI